MSTEIAPISQKAKVSALAVMADRLQVDPQKLLDTLKATVFKNASAEELLALVVVANAYGLNPLTKEIYAFPGKSGGIVPVISIDGWANLANSHPQMDGIDFEWEHSPDGKLVSCTAVIYRKDRSRPVRITEYLSECRRNTDPWKMEHRMLRHKALSQGVRIAFGFSGVYDEDEAKDIALNQERAINATERHAAPVPALLREETEVAKTPAPVKGRSKPEPEPVIVESEQPEPERQQASEPEPPLEEQPEISWDGEQQEQPEPTKGDAAKEEPAESGIKMLPGVGDPAPAKAPINWKETMIHFGKETKGKTLGELPQANLSWFQKTWLMEARKTPPGDLSDEDKVLIAALEVSLQPKKLGA